MEIANFLPKGPEDAGQINEGDYKDSEGLWHCGKCGKARQKKINTSILKGTVWCICDCKKKELEERKKQDEYEEEMRRVRRMKDASMMANIFRNASFSSYAVRKENEKAFRIATAYARDFRTMVETGHPKTGEKNVGIVFYGKCGTGKSWTAACIANELLNQHVSVIMTSFVKILQEIQGSMDEAQYIGMLNSCSLLIIDDLGAERNTDYALEKVYNVIDSRVRAGKPMILTTNLTFDEMMQNPDIRYRRIYDRIFEHCIPVEIPGNSFRIMRAAKRQKELEDYF
ncbi:MAG: ATP-binding protein [Eubacteriales bacterium]|nr:ATP-binding protein [Eubacteriales bacterium]